MSVKRVLWELRAFRLLVRYRKKGAGADIERACRLFRRARDAAAPGTFAWALSSRALGEALELRYERTRDPGLLTEALGAVRAAVDAVPAADPIREMFVRALVDLLSSRFETDRAALEEAAALARQVTDGSYPGDPDRGRKYELLGSALHSLFLLTSDPDVLAGALAAAREAIAAGLRGDGDAVTVSVAASQLHALFEVTGDAGALADAVAAGRAAAARARKDRDRVVCLNNLGNALNDLATLTDDLSLLNEAVQVTRDTLALTAEGDPVRASVLGNLGIGLRTLAETTGDGRILAEAAAAGRASVAATAAGDPELYARLAMLEATLIASLKSTGDPAVLEEATQVARQLTAISPADRPDRVKSLFNHAAALRDGAAWNGGRALLLEAIEAARRAVAAAPPGHSMRGGALVMLGQALMRLGERDADLGVSQEAAQVMREAVAALPPGHHELADALSPLGVTLRDIWRLTGDREILAEAVEAGRSAVAAGASAEGHRRATYLSNLGITLHELYYAAPDDSLGAETAQVLRDAVRAAPPGDPTRPLYQSNLCMALRGLSVDQADPVTAREAVQAGRAAAAAAPPGSPDRPGHLANLGRALMNLAEQAGDRELAREAVAVSREAVTATRGRGSAEGTAATLLGMNLSDLFALTGDAAVLAEARHALAEADRSPDLTPRERLIALRFLANAEMTAGDGRRALAACERAVALLPQIASRRLARTDREHALGTIFQFPAEAAAAATAAGDPERAVTLLEQTRGLLMGEAIDARGGTARLRSRAPALADQFTRLRDRLDAAADRVAQAGPRARAEEAEERARLAREWEDLLTAIREVDGLGDFLRPASAAQLAKQAQDGPVVLLYATAHRSDALILQASPAPPVRVVPLAGLTRQEVIEQAGRLAAATGADGDPSSARDEDRLERQVSDVLAWLWDRVTGPVLDALGLRSTPGDGERWPRVWWCPVGELAFLPLHAAGRHGIGAGGESARATVADRVVSSSTPTVRALEHARRRDAGRRGGSAAALVVAMPQTPAARPLPGTVAEAEYVAALIPGSLVLTGPAATRDAVRAAIPGYQVAHFACHGVSDGQDPGSSGLLLYDHAAAPLTVAELSRLQLPNAALAFLSACDTATSSERLADEVLHITAAFQLAGYSRVIGTLWPVRDLIAASMCREVYRALTRDATRPVLLEDSGPAVHAATRRLRERFPASPSVWAAFVHFGA